MDDEEIILIDDEGNQYSFNMHMVFEVGEKSYALLQPTDEEEETAVALRIEEDEDGEEVLVNIEDDEEFERVARAVEEQLGEEE